MMGLRMSRNGLSMGAAAVAAEGENRRTDPPCREARLRHRGREDALAAVGEGGVEGELVGLAEAIVDEVEVGDGRAEERVADGEDGVGRGAGAGLERLGAGGEEGD